MSLRAARSLAIAEIRTRVSGQPPCHGSDSSRGGATPPSDPGCRLPLRPPLFDRAPRRDAEIDAIRHPAGIDLNIENGGWHSRPRCLWCLWTGTQSVLHLRPHGPRPRPGEIKPRAPSLMGPDFAEVNCDPPLPQSNATATIADRGKWSKGRRNLGSGLRIHDAGGTALDPTRSASRWLDEPRTGRSTPSSRRMPASQR